MSLFKKSIAEFVGTLVLVVIGCGVAIVTFSLKNDTAYVIATALAFGLSIIAIAYSIGTISGCHINPAVSLGVLIYNKITAKKASDGRNSESMFSLRFSALPSARFSLSLFS